MASPLDMKGACSQCLAEVVGPDKHKMGCSYGDLLYLATYPEVGFLTEDQVQKILNRAEAEGWIK